MKEKKDNTIIYIVSTISFIIMGIILTTVINNTKSNDIRLRASATSGIAATATVSKINSDTNSIIVDQLIFVSSPTKGMGSWIVTPPSNFKFSSVTVGDKINLVIDPTTLVIPSHTLSAKEIKK